jgi:hypothetical protein
MKIIFNHFLIMFVVNFIGTFLWLYMSNREAAFIIPGMIQAGMLVFSAVGLIDSIINRKLSVK